MISSRIDFEKSIDKQFVTRGFMKGIWECTKCTNLYKPVFRREFLRILFTKRARTNNLLSNTVFVPHHVPPVLSGTVPPRARASLSLTHSPPPSYLSPRPRPRFVVPPLRQWWFLSAAFGGHYFLPPLPFPPPRKSKIPSASFLGAKISRKR